MRSHVLPRERLSALPKGAQPPQTHHQDGKADSRHHHLVFHYPRCPLPDNRIRADHQRAPKLGLVPHHGLERSALVHRRPRLHLHLLPHFESSLRQVSSGLPVLRGRLRNYDIRRGTAESGHLRCAVRPVQSGKPLRLQLLRLVRSLQGHSRILVRLLLPGRIALGQARCPAEAGSEQARRPGRGHPCHLVRTSGRLGMGSPPA